MLIISLIVTSRYCHMNFFIQAVQTESVEKVTNFLSHFAKSTVHV